jgi:hypothetical protein
MPLLMFSLWAIPPGTSSPAGAGAHAGALCPLVNEDMAFGLQAKLAKEMDVALNKG